MKYQKKIRVGGRQGKEGGRRSHITYAFIKATFLQNKGENNKISPETSISTAVKWMRQEDTCNKIYSDTHAD